MSKQLKAGLLFASALLLVACGSADTNKETDSNDTASTGESQELVESEGTEDSEGLEGTEGSVDQEINMESYLDEVGIPLVYPGEPDEDGTYYVYISNIKGDGEITYSNIDYTSFEGLSLRVDDKELDSKLTKLEELVLNKKGLTEDELTKLVKGADFSLDDPYVQDFMKAVLENLKAYPEELEYQKQIEREILEEQAQAQEEQEVQEEQTEQEAQEAQEDSE